MADLSAEKSNAWRGISQNLVGNTNKRSIKKNENNMKGFLMCLKLKVAQPRSITCPPLTTIQPIVTNKLSINKSIKHLTNFAFPKVMDDYFQT